MLQSVLTRVLGAARAADVAVTVSVLAMCAMAALGVWWHQPVLVYFAAVMIYDHWRARRAPRPTT